MATATYTLREMASSDVHEAILPLGHEFERVIGSPIVRIVDDLFVANCRRMIDLNVMIVLAAYDDTTPVGVLSAFIIPDYKCGEVVVQEDWFYVQPAHRHGVGSMLLRGLEGIAKARGAKRVCVGRLHHLDEAVAAFYTKHNYVPFETWSFKGLG